MSTAAEIVHAAERDFIGALMDRPDRICEFVDLVWPEDIFAPQLRAVYEAMIALDTKRALVDTASIANELGPNRTGQMGGLAWILGLHVMASSPYLKHYAERVRACSISRQVGTRLGAIAALALAEPLNGSLHLEAAEQALYEIMARPQRSAAHSMSEAVPQLSERLANPDVRGRGVKTGIYDLDRLLGGLEKGALIVIGARPSVGKSTLGLVMAHNLASVGERVLFFSLEMSEEVVVDRLLSINSGLSLKRIRENTLESVDREKAIDRTYQLGTLPLYIDASPMISVSGIRSQVRRLSHRDPFSAVFVDYLQLVSPPSTSVSRVEQVGTISKGLKQLAREFNVPVISAAQLNRKADEHSIPVLSDLRESGSIEADADVVLFIHRPNRTDDDAYSEKCDLICAKNRNGPTRTVSVYFEPKPARFVPIQEGQPI